MRHDEDRHTLTSGPLEALEAGTKHAHVTGAILLSLPRCAVEGVDDEKVGLAVLHVADQPLERLARGAYRAPLRPALDHVALLLEDEHVAIPTEELEAIHEKAAGTSPLFLAVDNTLWGVLYIEDPLKENVAEVVEELRAEGFKRVIMLTGDNKHTAKVIAGQAGVDKYQAELLPEDKLQVIAQLARHGVTGMVGDGINDAPALAQAGIGFAMAGGGTDAAIETADVALMDDDLRKIPRFIGLSRSTYAILLQNITLALGMKALFFVLAFMGLATMWMAVFADVGTSLLVVVNGLRAMRK